MENEDKKIKKTDQQQEEKKKRKHTEETKQKISKSLKSVWQLKKTKI